MTKPVAPVQIPADNPLAGMLNPPPTPVSQPGPLDAMLKQK